MNLKKRKLTLNLKNPSPNQKGKPTININWMKNGSEDKNNLKDLSNNPLKYSQSIQISKKVEVDPTRLSVNQKKSKKFGHFGSSNKSFLSDLDQSIDEDNENKFSSNSKEISPKNLATNLLSSQTSGLKKTSMVELNSMLNSPA